jgi:hypothetical protein
VIFFFSGLNVYLDLLKSSVTAITGNSQFIAIGCLNGDLCIYTPGGRRMFPSKLVSDLIQTSQHPLVRGLLPTCTGTKQQFLAVVSVGYDHHRS